MASVFLDEISNSAEETALLAQKFALRLRAGDVVLLEGEMGAGKTAFAKGVARGLGVEEEVTSPTYAYMNEYDGEKVKLYHYDCYRVQSVEQAENLGLGEYFYAGGVCLVEWSQNIAALLPENCYRVRLEKLGDEKRRITAQ